MNLPRSSFLLLAFAINCLQAADIIYTGIEGGEWATDSNWSSATYPTSSDVAFLDTTANMSVETPNNIRAIRVGTNGSGRLQITNYADFLANSNSTSVSQIGNGSGNDGYVQQENGTVEINKLEIGSDSGTGTYHIHCGSLKITRDTSSYSLFLGTNTGQTQTGTGTFIISSGSFETRAGVYLGSSAGGIGRFEVIGSHPGTIGIGSNGTLDGIWTQNTGSTLSVRIDKTSQGVTPIFIDDVGQNGGGDGDVVFENGALLDVDFTGSFINGGTFIVMEWEGDVTDNGLQFAPSVDTNIWSFQVDVANKRLTVTAAGNAISRNFVHPGLSHKLADLDRMRDMVAAGIEPYASTYTAMAATSRAQHTYQPSSAAADLATNGGQANNNALRADGVAAYYNALMWYITGDSRHAEASIRIFTAWSGVKNIDGIPLNAGRHWRLIEAAEIIKHTYSGWDPVDMQAFKDMLVYPGYSNTTEPTGDRSIYWRAFQGDPARHGNQGLFAMRCVMAIGVFLDNETMYDRALRYLQGAPARADDIPYVTGPSIANTQIGTYEHFLEYSRTGQETTIPDYGYNEVIHNYIYPNGQGQEFSRDMAHGLAGIGIIATMSEMAWSQGDDLYGYLNNRPLLGLEYFYRYNISFTNSFPDQTTSWEPTVENGEFIQRLDQSGRWFSLKANPYLAQNVGPEFLKRGLYNDDPMYEMNLAHYRDRIGVASDDTKWLQRGLDLLIADQGFEGQGTPWDHPSWGGLTFRRVSPGDPISGFTGDTPNFAMNSLPMTIEAENYDHFPLDGEGRTYHDLSSGNSGGQYRKIEAVDISTASEGGFALSNIESGEWLTYTVSVPDTTDYDISIRYASSGPGGTIQFSFDGTDVTGNVAVPHGAPDSTGATDWQTLVIASDVPLTQGVQQLTITFSGTSNAFLLNNFTIDTPVASPIAHWRFEEGSGNIANDCSGNGHHGTINNPSWTTRPDGGDALSFNGSDANVVIPGSAFTTLNDEVTLAFWAYGDSSLPATTVAFFAGTAGGSRILNVHLPWDNSSIYWDASDRIDKVASESEFEGSWAHWVFTKDATTGVMRIYRNGALWHSGTGKTNPISTVGPQAYIGSEGNSRYYNGLLDDFRLYDVALSQTAVANLYANALNPHTLTYSAGVGGSISGITSQTIDHTSDGCPVTAVADANNFFVDWSDGSTDNPRTDLNVIADINVTANFQTIAIKDAFSTIESEDYDDQSGINTETCTDSGGGLNIGFIHNGDYTAYYNVDFGSGANEFQARVASNTSGGNIEIRLDNPTGTVLGTANVPDTGGWQNWIDVTANITNTSGVHNVYLVFTGGSGYLFNVNWFTFALTRTLTYNEGPNGSISGTTPQTVDYNTNGSAVTAVADANYHFVNWSDGSTDNPRTDLNVTADITVTANFAIDTYDLTYTAGANGSITGTSPQTIDHNANGTAVTAVPVTNYHFVDWSDGSTDNPRTDLAVTANINVTANFAIDTYTLTYTAGANGSITGTSPQTIDHNANGTAVTAVPATNYHFVNWSDGSTANPRTDLAVTSDINVTANFAIDTYTLTYTAGANGSITGTSPQTIDHNANGTAVTAVPVTNYHFVDWSDGSNDNPRTDLAVTSDINVTANFSIDTYTMTYTAGANGSITGTSPQTVDYNLDGDAVTAVPAANHHFVDWSDGSTDNPRTDLAVTTDINVTANFAIDTYTLTYTAGANGSITGTSPQTIDHNLDGDAVTAVPAANHHFVDWSDGSTDNPRTDLAVTADINVTANFAIDTYTLTYTAGANGSITGNTSQTIDHGSDATQVTALPAANYHFVDWSDGSTDNPRTDTNVTAIINVTANFSIDTYAVDYIAGANGSITGNTSQTIDHGTDATQVTAVPATNYHFVDWSDGSTDNPRTDTNVTAIINVTANFAIDTYTVDYIAGANGSITGNTSQTIDHGSDAAQVTAVPAANHHFVDWSDGSTDNPRTDLAVTAIINVTANFAIDTYTLTYTAGANGSITGTSPQTVDYNLDGDEVTAVPATNYHFVNWSDGSTDNPRADLAVTADITVTANFAEDNTELENWRFTHFGTYDNTGTAADGFDADLDGILNLIEYATGTDPNSPSISSFRIRPSAGSGFEVRFDRILDSSLNYTVEGADHPGAAIWNPIWTGGGTSNGEVIVPDTLWPGGTKYFLRLNVSY